MEWSEEKTERGQAHQAARWNEGNQRFGWPLPGTGIAVYSKTMATKVYLENSEVALLARAFASRSGDPPKEAALVLLKAKLPETDTARRVRLG